MVYLYINSMIILYGIWYILLCTVYISIVILYTCVYCDIIYDTICSNTSTIIVLPYPITRIIY